MKKQLFLHDSVEMVTGILFKLCRLCKTKHSVNPLKQRQNNPQVLSICHPNMSRKCPNEPVHSGQ